MVPEEKMRWLCPIRYLISRKEADQIMAMRRVVRLGDTFTDCAVFLRIRIAANNNVSVTAVNNHSKGRTFDDSTTTKGFCQGKQQSLFCTPPNLVHAHSCGRQS